MWNQLGLQIGLQVETDSVRKGEERMLYNVVELR